MTWKREELWVYRNERGDIVRAQDENPSEVVKQVKKIYKGADTHESQSKRL